MGHHLFPSVITISLLYFLQLTLAWKLIIVALIVTDIKTFPLVWHLRLLNALRFVLPSQRTQPGPTSDCVFQPLVTSSHCSLSEMDFNWHKSNSTYYSDLDIARTHLLSTLFSAGIDRKRHEYGNGLLGVQKGSFTIKLGAVRCSFKREIRPYQRYEMWTRVLSWESKWLYTITHFVRREPKKNGGGGGKIVCASAISKCVFKAGRRTITPVAMLSASGLLPPGIVGRWLLSFADGSERMSLGDNFGVSQKDQFELETLQQCDFGDGDERTECQQGVRLDKGRWTGEMIENERRRGMGVVNEGDLDNLEHDFLENVDILGRHFDL